MLMVSVRDSSDVVILDCVGKIIRGEETGLLCAAVQRHGRNIVLDLSKVDGIDAAGVGALVALQAAGIYLRLMNPTKPVREVLRVTGLGSVFEISEFNTSEVISQDATVSFPASPVVSELEEAKKIEAARTRVIAPEEATAPLFWR
jgi:anti-anti-sigma factor